MLTYRLLYAINRSLEGSLGTTPLIPFSGIFARRLKEPSKQQEVLENPLFYRKLMRVTTMLQFIEVRLLVVVRLIEGDSSPHTSLLFLAGNRGAEEPL